MFQNNIRGYVPSYQHPIYPNQHPIYPNQQFPRHPYGYGIASTTPLFQQYPIRPGMNLPPREDMHYRGSGIPVYHQPPPPLKPYVPPTSGSTNSNGSAGIVPYTAKDDKASSPVKVSYSYFAILISIVFFMID